MRLVPIDSTKNYVQFNTQIATATVGVVTLAGAASSKDIDETDIAKTYYVEEGSSIRGINLGLRVFNESGVADSNSTVIALRKTENSINTNPAVPPGAPSLAQMNTLGTAPFKARLFHVEQAITGSQVSGWPMGFPGFKIPKRFHVMHLGDWWQLYIANNTGNNLRICGVAMYKYYK